MRILLVQPDSPAEIIGWGDLGAIAEPLALEYLAAGALADGHVVRILDLRLHPGSLDGVLAGFDPDVTGFTGYSMHVLRNLELCREVKTARPGCTTVVGGHHATLLPEDFFAPEVDHVVVGEGVAPIRALLRQLESGVGEPSVPGTWTRTADGRFRCGPEAASFDIDDIPVPARELVPEDRPSYYIDWMRPIALMRNTVGCPFRCSFCSLWKIMDGRYHKRTVDAVVDELGGIDEDYVFLVDDEAFIGKKRMTELAQAIRAAGIDKRYFTYCRIDTLIRFRDMIELWRDIGLQRLFIGIESITDDELVSYNKRQKVAQVEEGLRVARDLGISVFAGFIVNTDFTERNFQRLVRFIEHNDIDYPSFTILTPLPGTAALSTFDEVTARQPGGRPDWSKFDLQHPVTATRLPEEDFMAHYRSLCRTFSPTFAEHRDVRALVDQRPRG